MSCHIVYSFKDDAVVRAGRLTVDFGIKEIAESYHAAHECSRDAEKIRKVQESVFVDSAVKKSGKDETESAAVACESALPYFKDFKRMGEVKFGIVCQTVTESCPDNGTGNHVSEKFVQSVRIKVSFFKLSVGKIISEQKTYGEEQAVPS